MSRVAPHERRLTVPNAGRHRQRPPPSPVLATLRLLPRVSGRMTSALGAGVVLAAALPAGFALATGALIGSISDAAGRGLD